MAKDYKIEKIERPEDVIKQANGNIAFNALFAIAGFTLAGVSFGLGLGPLLSFGGVGITTASIKALRDNIQLKAAAKEQIEGKSK